MLYTAQVTTVFINKFYFIASCFAAFYQVALTVCRVKFYCKVKTGTIRVRFLAPKHCVTTLSAQTRSLIQCTNHYPTFYMFVWYLQCISVKWNQEDYHHIDQPGTTQLHHLFHPEQCLSHDYKANSRVGKETIQSINQSINQSVSQWICWTISSRTNQPASQSASQPVAWSVSQTISQSVSQSVSQPASKPVNKSANYMKPGGQSVSQPASPSISH